MPRNLSGGQQIPALEWRWSRRSRVLGMMQSCGHPWRRCRMVRSVASYGMGLSEAWRVRATWRWVARKEHSVGPPAKFFLSMVQAVAGRRCRRLRKRDRRRPFWLGMQCSGWTMLLRRQRRLRRARTTWDVARVRHEAWEGSVHGDGDSSAVSRLLSSLRPYLVAFFVLAPRPGAGFRGLDLRRAGGGLPFFGAGRCAARGDAP
jgi:hypothetical protein